ncbi:MULTISPECIES: hypothetical protein [unclassified Isoptericola]|uniref:hypothetical protein n=1 Tax=Isoptericola sp. NPDC057191 TaxID=3346041 RepID=UPI00362A580B
MAPPARILVAFTLLGAGLVNLGSARGALARPQGVFALVLGAVELVAALLLLRGVTPGRADPAVLARVGVGLLMVASVLGLALAVAPGGHLGAAAASAAALQLAGAATVGAATRPRPEAAVAPAAPPAAGSGSDDGGAGRRRPAGSLAVLFVGAVLVSTATTAGLTDTEAGAVAVPHSEHHLPDLSGLQGHHHGG